MTATPMDCENLSELGVRRRRTLGFVGAAGALAWVVGLAGVGAPAAAFLSAGLPAWASALGLIQARERTCIRLAAAGVREGPGMRIEPMPDADLPAVRARARRITRQATFAGLAVGLLAALAAWFLRGH